MIVGTATEIEYRLAEQRPKLLKLSAALAEWDKAWMARLREITLTLILEEETALDRWADDGGPAPEETGLRGSDVFTLPLEIKVWP